MLLPPLYLKDSIEDYGCTKNRHGVFCLLWTIAPAEYSPFLKSENLDIFNVGDRAKAIGSLNFLNND